MLLYVINVDSCIHIENYRIFFYEPVAKKQLEIFEASWNIDSLTCSFGRIAEHINRRGFENRDYQVIVCVRRKENERWKESTLYAKAMVCQAMEQSKALSIVTGAFTRKVHVLFQVEQPYYGTVPRTSVWEEELLGLDMLMDVLGLGDIRRKIEKERYGGGAGEGNEELVNEWESALYEVLESTSTQRMDSVTVKLKESLYQTLEAERQMEQEDTSVSEEELLEEEPLCDEDENRQDVCEYISHRLRSLLDGSGLNRASEVIYWSVPMENSRAARISTLGMVDLIRNGQEVTLGRVRECFLENHPEHEKMLLWRYRKALWGYRQQLCEKRQQILQEISDRHQNEYKTEEQIKSSSIAVPEVSSVLSERIELAEQQLLNCAVSLKRSSRNEVKERIDDISQSLAAAFDGMETELFSYQNEVKEYLYRELADLPYTKMGNIVSGKNQGECVDEMSAKAYINQWKQDMQLLIECTRLTGMIPAVLCFGITAVCALFPYLLYQGSIWMQKTSLVSALCTWGLIGVFLIGKRMVMSRYFVTAIAKSYAHLEQKLGAVLAGYKNRAEDFRADIRQLLETQQEAQKQQVKCREKEKQDQVCAMRAWHLANLKKAIDGLDTFGPMEQGFLEVEKHPEMIRRILQPMDYFAKEQDNEIYWPVIDADERGGER